MACDKGSIVASAGPAMKELQNTPRLPLVPSEVKEEARRLYDQAIQQGTPPNTARAYKSDFAYFAAWYKAHFGELPAEIPWAVEVLLVFVGHHALGQMPPAVALDLVEQGRLRTDDEGLVACSDLGLRPSPDLCSTEDSPVETVESWPPSRSPSTFPTGPATSSSLLF